MPFPKIILTNSLHCVFCNVLVTLCCPPYLQEPPCFLGVLWSSLYFHGSSPNKALPMGIPSPEDACSLTISHCCPLRTFQVLIHYPAIILGYLLKLLFPTYLTLAAIFIKGDKYIKIYVLPGKK